MEEYKRGLKDRWKEKEVEIEEICEDMVKEADKSLKNNLRRK